MKPFGEMKHKPKKEFICSKISNRPIGQMTNHSRPYYCRQQKNLIDNKQIVYFYKTKKLGYNTLVQIKRRN